VLNAHAADWDRAGQPVPERRAAIARKVIDKSRKHQRMRPVEFIRLLPRAPSGDHLNGHM
jgi:hypothetical protein